MNTVVPGTTAPFANLVTPFSPVGKQAVGLENAEAKEEVLAPVEEPTETARGINRPRDELKESQVPDKENGAETSDDDKDLSAEQRREREAGQAQELQEREQIRELAARDREVRAHEQAHAAVGGQYAGSPGYTYQRGPDGVNYAVGGEVPIAIPRVGNDPEAALSAAEQVRRAALAPTDPSAQDRRVAAQAARVALDARAAIVELESQQRTKEAEQKEAQNLEQQEADEEQEQVRQVQQQEQRDKELLADSRHRAQVLSDQLVAVNNIDSDQAVGVFLDQKA